MSARLTLVLSICAVLTIALVASATAAPTPRATSLISTPTGVADPNIATNVNFKGASSDGSRVFFETVDKLTADDNDSGRTDVYERSGGATTLVSKENGVTDPDTADVNFRGASDDGSRVFFTTSQKLTTDDNDSGRVDVYERSGGATTLVSAPTGLGDLDTSFASFGGSSADGSRVFFTTSQKLTADDGDTGRSDVYERSGGTTTLVSQPTGVADPDSADTGFRDSSDDGSRVFFTTSQKLTADDGDTGRSDVYERSGGTTTLISQPTGVTDPDTTFVSFSGASADGSRVFLETTQKLTADDGDTNLSDVYERSGGATTLVSQPTGVTDPATDEAFMTGASADGSRVFFETTQKLTADDGDTNLSDVYERSGGATTLVSKPTGVVDPGNDEPGLRGTSADGTHVFFSTSQGMTADDGDSDRVDVYDRSGGVTTLISKATGITQPDSADADFEGASADGSRVFFETNQNMTADPADTNLNDVYERSGGATALVSKPTGVADPNSGGAFFSGASADGSRVFFETIQRLAANDNDSNREDIYVAEDDTTAPQTTITGGPSGTTSDATPTFSFVSSEVGSTFQCKLDSGAFASCTSPKTLAALADGSHSFQVRAVDGAGNLDASPAVRSFTVDTPSPSSPFVPPLLDTSAPLGRLSGKKTQKLGKSVSVTVACLDEGCRAVATGKAGRLKLKRARKAIAKGGKAKLKLKLSKKARKALRRALRRHRKVKAKLKVTVSDAAGNKRVLRRTVRLRR